MPGTDGAPAAEGTPQAANAAIAGDVMTSADGPGPQGDIKPSGGVDPNAVPATGQPPAKEPADTPPADNKGNQPEPTPADSPKEPAAPKDEPKSEPTPKKPTAPVEPSLQIPDSLLSGEPSAPAEPPKDESTEEWRKVDINKLPEKGNTRQNFANMRTKIESLESELSTIKSTKPADAGELEQLQAQNTELLEKIGRLDLQQHPAFQKKYDVPASQVVKQLKNIAQQYEVEEAVIDRAIRLPIKDRMQFLDASMPDAKAAVMPLFATFDQLMFARVEAIENHKASLEEVQKEYDAQAASQMETMNKELEAQVLKDLEGEGFFMFSTVAGNEEWNKSVATLKGQVTKLFETDDPKEQGTALAMSVAAPVLLQLFNSERAKRLAAENALTERGIATPSVGGDSGPKEPVPEGQVPKEMTAEGVAGFLANKHNIGTQR